MPCHELQSPPSDPLLSLSSHSRFWASRQILSSLEEIQIVHINCLNPRRSHYWNVLDSHCSFWISSCSVQTDHTTIVSPVFLYSFQLMHSFYHFCSPCPFSPHPWLVCNPYLDPTCVTLCLTCLPKQQRWSKAWSEGKTALAIFHTSSTARLALALLSAFFAV